MLKEERPNAAAEESARPVLLARSLFSRFVNRRSMAWLTLIAAIWLVITINERRQNLRPLVEADKKVALVKDRKAESPAPLPAGQFVAREDAKVEQAAAAWEPAKTAAAGESAALVHCDLSPEAAHRRAFEKLLDANGVTWRQRTMPPRVAEGQVKTARDADQLPRERSLSWPSLAAGEQNLVEIEATPAQLEATLAGLKAQPALFRSFSVLPNTRVSAKASSSFARGAASGPSPSPPASPLAGRPPPRRRCSMPCDQQISRYSRSRCSFRRPANGSCSCCTWSTASSRPLRQSPKGDIR